MRNIGSASIETLDEAELTLVSKTEDEAITSDDSGKWELWSRIDGGLYSGYNLEIDGQYYEFVRSFIGGTNNE
jgi:hypothetical protein